MEGETQRVDLHESTEESCCDFQFCFEGELDAPYSGYDRDNKEKLEDGFDGG